MKIAYIGRDILSIHKSALSWYFRSLPVLGALLLALPALICSCHHDGLMPDTEDQTDDGKTVMTKVMLDDEDLQVGGLDIFTFEDGELQILDSYQRIDDIEGEQIQIASRRGDRLLFACANGQWEREDWMYVNSYESMTAVRAFLENESQMFPLMTGTCRFTAGDRQDILLELERISAEVVLRSVICDFSGKSYEEEGIQDIKIYLINVNAQCCLEPADTVMPERIMNMGGISDSDMSLMNDTSLLVQECEDLQSGIMMEPDIRLRCYPNSCPEESPGSPYTRLTLEGKIQGETWYWSVDVGRDDGGCGVERNTRYVYDLVITGKGTKDPDVPSRKEDISIEMEVKQWKEKDYSVLF